MYQLQLAGEELAASARGVAQRLMHHQQAGNAGRPAMVQKRYIKCTVVVHFARAPLRRILPDLSLFCHQGPLCGLFILA